MRLKHWALSGLLWTGLAAAPGMVAPVRAKISQDGTIPDRRLQAGETGRVMRVIDGDTLVLESGLKVQLASILAPRPASKRTRNAVATSTGRPAEPVADTARKMLIALTKGRKVRLYYGGKHRDRYNRAVAQVMVLGQGGKVETWAQQVMVGSGMARVYTWPGTTQNTALLYKAERAARKARQGIWDSKATNGYYDIRKPDPDPLAQHVDSVQIVEGVVVKIAEVRGTIYLNFGANYRTDFTIAISKKAKRAFKNADYDPLKLTGARVRVRGYIELYGGPIIWLNTPSRLEVMD